MLRGMRGITLLTVAAAMNCLAGTSFATTVNATFSTVSPGETFNYTLDGTSESTSAGVFNWTSVAGGTNNFGSFDAFCIELTQTINYGGTYLYNIDPLANGPTPGLDTGGPNTSGPMGAMKASQLSELWGRYFNTISTGSPAQQNVNAAAFQIAVWDIVFGSNLSLTQGYFVADNPSDADVVLAQSWLNGLNGTGPMADLVALDSPTDQDMVTAVPGGPSDITAAIPEAATSVTGLLGLGVLALLAARRRAAL
jgi:hypothetical protein